MENLNWNGKCKRSTACLSMLPADCTEKILALTSPLDVCRISLLSKSLQSAAESDSVWEKFLPSDYQSIISASLTPVPDFPSKKDLYLYLCHHPLSIDAGRKVIINEQRGKWLIYFFEISKSERIIDFVHLLLYLCYCWTEFLTGKRDRKKMLLYSVRNYRVIVHLVDWYTSSHCSRCSQNHRRLFSTFQ